ncbi:unnamed protein product [Auanema sp. JU1783]|nr:unnamed protein product [Auanema sp. JU1783]
MALLADVYIQKDIMTSTPGTSNVQLHDNDISSSSCNAMRWARKPWKHLGYFTRDEAVEILADRFVSQKRRVQMRGCVRIIYYCHVQRSNGCRYEMNVCVPNNSEEKLRIDDFNEHTCNHEEARLKRRVKPHVADFDRPFKKSSKLSTTHDSLHDNDSSFLQDPVLSMLHKIEEPTESNETNESALSASSSTNEHLANLFTNSLMSARQKLIWKEVDMDILDFSNRSDGIYKFIFHVVDKGSQYSHASPLTSTNNEEICESIKTLFFQFGPPATIYVEDTYKVLEDELRKFFPSLSVMPHCSRRKSVSAPQLLRREAVMMKDRILAWLMENNTTEWSKNLSFIKYLHNTEWLDEIDSTPLDLFFGRHEESTNGLFEDCSSEV